MASAQSWPAHPKPRTRHRTSQLRPPRHPPEPARSEHWSVGVGTGDCRSGCAYDRAKPHSLRSYGFALSSAPPSTDKLPARALRHQPMLRLLRLYGCCYVLHCEPRWHCPRLLSRLRCTRIGRLKPGLVLRLRRFDWSAEAGELIICDANTRTSADVFCIFHSGFIAIAAVRHFRYGTDTRQLRRACGQELERLWCGRKSVPSVYLLRLRKLLLRS